jgi:hypothetical protein
MERVRVRHDHMGLLQLLTGRAGQCHDDEYPNIAECRILLFPSQSDKEPFLSIADLRSTSDDAVWMKLVW